MLTGHEQVPQGETKTSQLRCEPPLAEPTRKALIFMMTSFKAKIAGAAVAALAIGGLAMAAAPSASATTGTCLGTQNPVSGPVSCGGLFLPGLAPAADSSGQPDAGTLSLTSASDYWNAPVTFSLYSPSLSTQDFTLYEVCAAAPATPTDALPCGSVANTVYNPAAGEPEFVTEVTPNGAHLNKFINGAVDTQITMGPLSGNPNNLCISEEGLNNGPKKALRWDMVDRFCNTGGAVFYAGSDDGPAGTGIAGTVVDPNKWQTFSAIPGNGGDLIANDQLSSGFKSNALHVVDDKGNGYPAGTAIVYAENDGKNQIASFVGCNGAVITTGVSYDCP